MDDQNTPNANANANANPNANAVVPASNRNVKRRQALTALAAVVVVAGLGWGAYEWLVASHYESTDNAYVQGNVVQITPQIGGTVVSVNADDTDYVQAGQPLVQLDPPMRRSRSTRPKPTSRRPSARCARSTPTTVRWPRR